MRILVIADIVSQLEDEQSVKLMSLPCWCNNSKFGEVLFFHPFRLNLSYRALSPMCMIQIKSELGFNENEAELLSADEARENTKLR